MNENSKSGGKNLPARFATSLSNWGGWSKLTTGHSDFSDSVSESIAQIVKWRTEMSPKYGDISPEDWQIVAQTFGPFLNAYLQQELSKLTDGPISLVGPLRLVDSAVTGQMMMALILVARENSLGVQIEYQSPCDKNANWETFDLVQNKELSVTICLRSEYGEEVIPILLWCHGKDFVADKDNSSSPLANYISIDVDRRLALFFDETHFGKTIHQVRQDEFFKGQGIDLRRFSSEEIAKDVFACAVESIRLVSGRSLAPAEAD